MHACLHLQDYGGLATSSRGDGGLSGVTVQPLALQGTRDGGPQLVPRDVVQHMLAAYKGML